MDEDIEQQVHLMSEDDDIDSEVSSSSEGSSSDESEEENPVEEEWTDRDTRKHFTFTETPKMETGSARTPIEYFKLFFSTTLMSLLVSIINMNGLSIATKQFTTMTEFKVTDIEEVYTLVALYFLMGYIRIHKWSYYWGAHPLYNMRFENYMDKDRFALLYRALAYRRKLSYDDVDAADTRRVWYDVAKPIAEYFNARMKTLVTPSKQLILDKYTANWFNGANLYRKKTDRIKMHLLSDVSGLFQRVYLCHPDKKNKGGEVAPALLKDFYGTGRSVYACPFYTSVSLAEDLLSKKVYLTGILKRNRQRNPAFVKSHVKVGTVRANYNAKGVCVSKYRKSAAILGLSTEHSGNLIVKGKTMLPEMIVHFKEYTRGMFDRNEMLTDNSPNEYSKKYNRTVLYLLQVMFMNAYLLYNANEPDKLTFSDFRMKVIEAILPLKKDRDDSESDEDTDASIDSSSDMATDHSEVIHLPSELSKANKRLLLLIHNNFPQEKSLKKKSYEERLQELNLTTLEQRRKRGDLIETYKILNDHYNVRYLKDMYMMNQNKGLRGHSLKLTKPPCPLMNQNKGLRGHSLKLTKPPCPQNTLLAISSDEVMELSPRNSHKCSNSKQF